MINRLFGWLFTLVALAVVVFAALNWGNYSSMCFDEEYAQENAIIYENEEPAEELPIVDSLSVDIPVEEDVVSLS
ncbi:MAG: hypothetical protein J6V26_02255 [Alistipes sp.]|nr:hypothetical protein [Alistipes sp.]